METSRGIGREGWRTLNGGQWRDWQRGVEDTEWRPVEGLAESDGRYRTVSKVDESGSSIHDRLKRG
ncbi:unnamed protein product [Staurois parvus]|uniref:Uncharacterized protein n=1 Tax=Staurois parvus TaxID=386267 RepID=A0ABN9FAT2_9NEOB|nr:unnamed protein product [Staurois parvus]